MVKKLELKFKAELKKLALQQKKLVIGVSTGVDSMVLLTLLEKFQAQYQYQIIVAYIDHQLRSQSQKETAFIKAYCQNHKLTLETFTWNQGDHPKNGIEAAARKVRYDFFAQVLDKYHAQYLLTAHHGDDQVETFLMKLTRGGDISQLEALKFQRDFKNSKLIRLLLPFSKTEIYDYAQKKQIKYFEDETNQTDEYFRNRLRHKVIPQLKQEQEQLQEHVQHYIEQIDTMVSIIDEQANRKVEDLQIKPHQYRKDDFLKLDERWQDLVLRAIFKKEALELKQSKLTLVKKVLQMKQKPQGEIDIQKNIKFYQEYSVFGFTNTTKKVNIKQEVISLTVDKWQKVAHGKIGYFSDIKHLQPGDEYLAFEKPVQLKLRHRMPGDKIRFSFGTKKLKKMLIDEKIPQNLREQSWVVANESNEILWVLGIKKTDLSHFNLNDKMQYILIYRKNKN